MKKIILIAAGLLAMSATPSFAQDAKPAASATPAPAQPKQDEFREKLMKMTPEQRKEYIQQHPEVRAQQAAKFQAQRDEFFKNLGINPDQFRTNSPVQRRTMMKEAITKKADELSKKKTAGTITPQEEQMLKRLDMMKRMVDRPVRSPQAPAAPKVPAPTK